ncbi:MAG: glycosyltransferase family 39 protein [Patescibacteria group bacterium]
MIDALKIPALERNGKLTRFTWILIVLIVLIGTIPRVASVAWNVPYLHDNDLYGNAATSLAERGDFKIGTVKVTNDALHYSVKALHGEYLSHNPLWPTISAGISVLTHLKLNGYDALAVLSFIFGIGVLFLLFYAGRLMHGTETGLTTLALGSFSFLLIDYSGNGSFYIFQAFLYLVFLCCLWRGGRWTHPILMGVLIGCALLTVHQSVALFPAYAIYLLFTHKWNWKKILRDLTICIATAILLYLPWGIRNTMLLGDFFPPTDTNYVWLKLGIPPIMDGDISNFNTGAATFKLLAIRILTKWLPDNLYFVNRQLFVLAPITYFFALFASAHLVFGRWWKTIDAKTTERLMPLLVLLGFHILISTIWPVTKFRYFTGMLPLVLLLGTWYIFTYLKRMRTLAIATSVLAMAVLSVMTYLGSPAHTYFYGGVLTTDPFSTKWEVDFVNTYNPRPRDPNL